MINKQLLLSKTAELGIPFQNVMAGATMECLLKAISTSQLAGELWLHSADSYSMKSYSRTCVRRLSYSTVSSKPFAETIQTFEALIKDALVGEGYTITACQTSETNQSAQQITFDLQLMLEDVYLPIQVSLRALTNSTAFPKEKLLLLFMENSKAITVNAFPEELAVAKDLALILHKLELIGDMSAYLRVYQTATREALEGRRLRMALQQECEALHMPLAFKPYDIWKTYGSYAYMKKQWKVLLRQQKLTSPQWEDVFAVIDRLVNPIWTSICADDIFFGDWMPELGRYLD